MTPRGVTRALSPWILRPETWLVAYAAAHMPRLFCGPVGIDLHFYRNAALAVTAGRAASAYSIDTGFLYSPLLLAMTVPLGLVGPRAGYVVLGLLGWASLFYLVRLLLRRLQLTGRRALAVTLLALATIERYFVHAVNLGQVDILILLALVLALVHTLDGKPFHASVCYALAVGCKLTPLAFIPYLFWRRQYRMLAVACAAPVLLTLAAAAAIAGDGAGTLLAAYARRLQILSAQSYSMNVSLLSFTTHDRGLRYASLALLVAAFVSFHAFMCTRVGPASPGRNPTDFVQHAVWWAWLMAFMLLASPVTWFVHLPLLLVAAMVAARALTERRPGPVPVVLYGLFALHSWGVAGRVLARGFGVERYPEETILIAIMLLLVTVLARRLPAAARDYS